MKHFFLIMALTLLAATPSTAETNHDQKSNQGLLNLDFSKDVTHITSQKLVLSNKKREFTYLGSVTVEHGDLLLDCDQLDGSYSEANEIQILIAKSNVHIKKGDNIRATGNKAVFSAKDQTIRLTENPQLEQDGSVLSADLVIIYMDQDRSEAQGNVRVSLIEKK